MSCLSHSKMYVMCLGWEESMSLGRSSSLSKCVRCWIHRFHVFVWPIWQQFTVSLCHLFITCVFTMWAVFTSELHALLGRVSPPGGTWLGLCLTHSPPSCFGVWGVVFGARRPISCRRADHSNVRAWYICIFMFIRASFAYSCLSLHHLHSHVYRIFNILLNKRFNIQIVVVHLISFCVLVN